MFQTPKKPVSGQTDIRTGGIKVLRIKSKTTLQKLSERLVRISQPDKKNI